MRCNFAKYSFIWNSNRKHGYCIFSHLCFRIFVLVFDLMCDVASTSLYVYKILYTHAHIANVEWDRMWCIIIMAIMEWCVCATETNSWYSIKINRRHENQPNKGDDTSNQDRFYLYENGTTKNQSDEDFYAMLLIEHIISLAQIRREKKN